VRGITAPSNVNGQAYALTVLTAVLPGHLDPLRKHLASLGSGGSSPLAALRTVHFARWLVIEQPVYQGAPQKRDVLRSPYLLFESCFDGDRDQHLETMRTTIGAAADAVWSHCVAYPGSQDDAAFAAYFRHNQVNANFCLAAYPNATVQEVRDSLALRQRLIDFAVTTQDLDAAALLAAYRELSAGPALP
jgi:hypothetical protein